MKKIVALAILALSMSFSSQASSEHVATAAAMKAGEVSHVSIAPKKAVSSFYVGGIQGERPMTIYYIYDKYTGKLLYIIYC